MADRLTLALVTCGELPVPDVDRPVLDALLAARGVVAEWVPWDDPGVDWSSYRAAWIRSTWNYTAQHRAFTEWVEHAAASTELWNPAPVVRWNSHKSYLLDLAERRVPVVDTVLVIGGEPLDLDEVMDARGWTEAVVKPAVSVGAIGASRIDRDAARDWSPDAGLGDLLVQPLVAEVTDGETSMIAVDGRVTHAVRKVPAPGDFRVQIEHGGREIACTPSAAELELAERALAAVGRPLLYARVDCVTTPDGPRLMELELIEPTLFLTLAPGPALDALGVAVATRLA